jgi:hypothetical protein
MRQRSMDKPMPAGLLPFMLVVSQKIVAWAVV